MANINQIQVGSTVYDIEDQTARNLITSYTETDPVFSASAAAGIASSDITAWNGKQGAITGGATTITSSNLTASRALVSDTNGKVAVSAVTSTELGYLDGVTSAVQTQLNSRATLDSGKVTASQASSALVSITANTTLALTHAGKLLYVNSTSARTITVPTNASVAFPTGTEIEIVRWNTGTVTIAAASGVSLVSTESARTISARYGVVAMKKMATDTWLLTGALG